MTSKELTVLLYGAPIGRLHCDRNAKLRFVYDDKSRSQRDAVPLSLSIPLTRREHGHEPVDAFLWGLLPDNEHVLERWARQFHVSARNPFALLSHVGEDCAGAVQIVSQDRADALQAPGPAQVHWLTESDVAERLRTLRGDETAWRRADDQGQFSLAGAQPKTALFRDETRWGIPIGRTPTTHILKPPTAALAGQMENEHFCLRLAHTLGLPVASSTIMRFDGEAAIVVERYDRVRVTSAMAAQDATLAELGRTQPVLRLHQEDMCQALGVRPQSKYQNEGGPSPEQIAELLRAHSDRPREDVQTFADALLYNWLIGASDGHAKNYAVLHGSRGRVRLAPFYDIASALPYADLNTPRLKLAMKLGGHYRLLEIGQRELRKMAQAMQIDSDDLIDRAREMSAKLPSSAQRVYDDCGEAGLEHPIFETLVHELTARAEICRQQLDAQPA